MPKLLLVDDEPDFLETTAFFLRGSGYQVLVAGNGIEALEQAMKALPDLVLMDVMMPEMNGLDACRQFKENPSLASIPIIMLTAKGQPQDIKDALAAGARNYMVKPVNLPDLFDRIERTLKTK